MTITEYVMVLEQLLIFLVFWGFFLIGSFSGILFLNQCSSL